MEDVNNNISLQDLSAIENLSVRSRNVCEWSNLNDILSILHYYWDNNDFSNLRNCGQKSNTELIGLCKKYEDFLVNSQQFLAAQETENPILQKIDSLTVRQKKILNNIIESQASALSVRSSNALNHYLDSQLSIRGLKKALADRNFNIKNLRNIGAKSEKELRLFLTNIKEQIEIISIFEKEEELTIELFNSILTSKFCLSPTILAEIGRDYNYSNGLPIFKTLHVLIKNEILFDHRDKKIFEKGLKYKNNSKVYSTDEIAKSLDLTKERIRQVRKQIYDNLNCTFSFIKYLEFDALNLFGLDIYSDMIILNDDIVSEINEKEQNNFNVFFVNKIFSILLNDAFSLIGNEEIILFNRTIRTSHNWNNTYLIKTELINIFDFDGFVNDVSNRLSEKNEEGYNFHFESYLLNFIKSEKTDFTQRIIPITEYIIFNEFKLSIDIYDQIIFKRKTKKQVAEYVYEVLEEKNEPLTVYELFDLIERKYPNTTKSAEALRGSCQRDTNLIFFGRSSTYGLKSWEDTDIVKGGTMHDISEEYLAQFDVPKHIDDIAEYVSHYRQDVTSKNLLYNLKSAENRRFVFFKNSHIGLVSKSYGVEFSKINKSKIEVKSWEENFLLLKDFVDEHQRLPFASGIDIEKRLYSFMNVQLNKAKLNKLELEKKIKFLDLIASYPSERKRRSLSVLSINHESSVIHQHQGSTYKNKHYSISSKWWDSYNELKEFLHYNKEYPKASNNRALYTFCYNCNRKLQDGSLQKVQIEALEKLDFSFSSDNQNIWEDNFSKLTDFYITNKKWPRCLNSDSEQIRLYRFCISLFKAYKSNKLSQEQLELLDNLGFPYSQGVFSNAWLDNYEKLKGFRIINPSRWPQARASELEKSLYQFCYRNKNKHINGTLEDYKVKLLNEINFDFYG